MVGSIGIGPEQRPIPQSPGALISRGMPIPDGTPVEGKVMSVLEGAYMVRIAGRDLVARSNLSLFPGQHFRALWDGRGEIPMLRLRAEDAALLGRLPREDREIASLLLSKGLPITDGFLLAVRREMRLMDGGVGTMNALIELMARGESISPEKVRLIMWYMDLDAGAVVLQWRKIQRELEQRKKKGENPLLSLRSMKNGDGETARFLQAHSMLSKPAKEDFAGASLTGSWWPAGDDGSIPATVRFSASSPKNGRGKFYRVDFSVEGASLGAVDGVLESDGKSMTISLKVRSDEAERTLLDGLPSLRDDLDGGALALQYLGISRKSKPASDFFHRLDVEA